MRTFLEFIEEQINEAGFEVGGKKYTFSFGRYYCDKKQISKEEYYAAKPSKTVNVKKNQNIDKISTQEIPFQASEIENSINKINKEVQNASKKLENYGKKFGFNNYYDKMKGNYYKLVDLSDNFEKFYNIVKENKPLKDIIDERTSNIKSLDKSFDEIEEKMQKLNKDKKQFNPFSKEYKQLEKEYSIEERKFDELNDQRAKLFDERELCQKLQKPKYAQKFYAEIKKYM